MDLEYEVAGKPYKVTGYLPVQDEPFRNGALTTLHVDPQHPTNWTNRTVAPSLKRQLIGPILLANHKKLN